MKTSVFKWNDKKSRAARMLGEGYTYAETAAEVGVTERTIFTWKHTLEFDMEVDRCSMIYGLASKAERNRLIMKAARQYVKTDGTIDLGKDTLLDYIKEARMNTDGVKLDIVSELASLDAEAGLMAGSRSDGSDEDDEEEAEKSD